MITLEPRERKIVKKILQKYLPECEIRVFGSRLDPTPKKYADLDLALVDKNKIPREILFAVQTEFEESDLPFRVDLLDWHRLSDEFRAIIANRYEILC